MKLTISQLNKSYGNLEILKDLHFEVNSGELVAVTGESGAGKSTFFNLLAGLDDFDSGEIHLGDYELETLTQVQKAKIRGSHIGIVFQEFHLVAALTALENVRLVLDVHSGDKTLPERNTQACDILAQVGLQDRLNHRPGELSGGEQQRVALARALVHQPPIILADEPTGNLDESTSAKVQSLLMELCRNTGSSLILITHDLSFAEKMDKQYKLTQGQFFPVDKK